MNDGNVRCNNDLRINGGSIGTIEMEILKAESNGDSEGNLKNSNSFGPSGGDLNVLGVGEGANEGDFESGIGPSGGDPGIPEACAIGVVKEIEEEATKNDLKRDCVLGPSGGGPGILRAGAWTIDKAVEEGTNRGDFKSGIGLSGGDPGILEDGAMKVVKAFEKGAKKDDLRGIRGADAEAVEEMNKD